MLHGYVVVVKRTGVDGSKFPVTERTIKIGVTAGCHILINTPYVADEHCALSVKDNGQVWVQNLSKDHTTALNENNIDSEALLNHADILEIGGRLVRWEYLPDSEFYYGSVATRPKGSQTSKSTPKQKTVVARSPKTAGSAFKGNTPNKQLINKIIGLKLNTPKSAKKTPTSKKVSPLTSPKKSHETPKAPKTSRTKSPQSINRASPKGQKTPSNKTPKTVKVEAKSVKKASPKAPKTPRTKSPQSINRASPKRQKTPLNKTPKMAKVEAKSVNKASPQVQNTPKLGKAESKSPQSNKKVSPQAEKTPSLKTPKSKSKTNSLIKSRGKTPLKVKTPKAIRKSLFTSPRASPKGKLSGNKLRKIDSPSIGKERTSSGNPNDTNRLSGRKSLQATKRLFIAADNALRKSDVVSKLNDEELLELANLNYRKKLSEGSLVKRQGTPLKRLSYSDKRLSRHPRRSSMMIPAMSTILEPASSNQIFTPKSNSPLKTPSPTSSAKVLADKDIRSRQVNTPINKRNSALPMITFSSEKKSPIKRLSLESRSPTKITAKELLNLMVLSNQTPPEVVTPERSPRKNKRNDNQSPLTPLYRVMTIGIADETPPEVVTPRSSMSSTKSSSSVTKLRNSLPNSPLASQSPVKSARKLITSPIESALSSPASPRKSAMKSCNSPRSSPRGNKENLNNSSSSPKVSFNLQSPKEEKTCPSKSLFSPIRSSDRILSETPVGLPSPASRKSSPVKSISAVTLTRSTPVKTTPNKDASQLSTSVSAVKETQHQSPLKRSSLRNSSPANISFKSARSSLGTPKATPIANKKSEAITKKKTKLNSQPDKTKKKALLVLGKASQRKTEMLKQKILKRAIKITNRQPRKKINQKTFDLPEILITSPSSIEKSPESRKGDTPTSPKNVSVGSRPSGSGFGSILKELAYPNITSPNYARRSSKRISAMHEVERPDFTELSPSALGLTPRFVQPVVTPKEKKRRSTSLTTPRTKRSPGTIKAVSTSKKSSKTKENDSTDSSFNFQTPDISQEVFVSPLYTPAVKAKNTPVSLRKRVSSRGALFDSPRDLISFFTPEKGTAKIPIVAINQIFSVVEEGDLHQSPVIPSEKKISPKSKIIKSPKNDLTNVGGIKRIFSKSPRNDLRRVAGVKKLLKTPQIRKAAVKRQAPKKQIKSPKNDLSNPLGVKKLFAVRKVQNSPKNDLINVHGVKTLFKPQKSPKNRLSDFKGMKNLLGSPKVQNEPENSYMDVRGVKALFGSPKVQKSPRNRLSDFRGVKKLLGSKKVPKSPKNRLSDFRGVKQLLGSPLSQNSPANDLTDLKGVRLLFASPKASRSPINDLRTVIGVKELFNVESPKPAQRKVRGAATPVTRPTRSKLSLEVKNLENDGESEVLSTKLRVRQKTLSSPKSDSPLKALVQEPDTTITPLRRGRPKRTATVALETENVVPPKSRRGATSKVRSSESSSSETIVKPRAAKTQSTPKAATPARKTRARGKTQQEPASSPTPPKKVGPKVNQRSKPQAKTQLETSPAKKVSPKALRSRTQTTDSASPITKAVRTRGKAQPASPAGSPKRKITRNTRAQSTNTEKKNASSKKTETSTKRGKRI